jgi:hypothetical protein
MVAHPSARGNSWVIEPRHRYSVAIITSLALMTACTSLPTARFSRSADALVIMETTSAPPGSSTVTNDEALGRMDHVNKGASALALPAHRRPAEGQRFQSRLKHGCSDLAMQQALPHEHGCAGPRAISLTSQRGHECDTLSTSERAAHCL